jgi:hypothetical protein
MEQSSSSEATAVEEIPGICGTQALATAVQEISGIL